MADDETPTVTEAARVEKHGRDNPYCMRCGNERGGPYGHVTNECTWRRKGEEVGG